MKAFVLILSTAISVASFGQFQKTETPKEILIGKSKTAGVKFAELYYYVTKENDTAYRLFYKDMRYSTLETWESVYLKGGQESLSGFYNALVEALAADKGAESTFKLDETSVLVKTDKSFGTKYLLMAFDNNGTGGLMKLTEKQLTGLFGKEE